MSMSLGDLSSAFNKAARALPQATEQGLRTLAQVGVGYVKEEIQKAHAVDTSTMLNSTTAEAAGKGAYLIGPTVKYAPYVALGTSRMAARPFHVYAARRLSADVKRADFLKDLGI